MSEELQQMRKLQSALAARLKALEDRGSESLSPGSERLDKVEMVVKAQQQVLNSMRAETARLDAGSLAARVATLEETAQKTEKTETRDSAFGSDVGDRLAKVEEKIRALPVADLMARLNKAEKALAEANAHIERLEAALKAQSSAASTLAVSTTPPPNAELERRLAALEKQMSEAAKSSSPMTTSLPPPLSPSSLPPPPTSIVAAVSAPGQTVPAASPSVNASNNTEASSSSASPGSSLSNDAPSDVLSLLDGAASHSPLPTVKRSKPRGGTRKLPSKKLAELGKEIAKEEEEAAAAAGGSSTSVASSTASEPSAATPPPEPMEEKAAAASKVGRKGSHMGVGVLPGLKEAFQGRRRSQTLGSMDNSSMRRASAPAVAIDLGQEPAALGPHLLKKSGARPLKKAPPKKAPGGNVPPK